MHLPAQVIVPLIVLLTATLWTFADFRLRPIHDLRVLPWPAHRSLEEGLVVILVWPVSSVVYWKAFKWSLFYQGLGVGFTWACVTLYCSTALRQRIIDKANREGGS